MKELSNDQLDRLLKESYGSVGVSPDFTLRLWKRLMLQPHPWFRQTAVPVLALAAAFGIVAGLRASPGLTQSVRWDLFGNAPHDTLAGSALRVIQEGLS